MKSLETMNKFKYCIYKNSNLIWINTIQKEFIKFQNRHLVNNK